MIVGWLASWIYPTHATSLGRVSQQCAKFLRLINFLRALVLVKVDALLVIPPPRLVLLKCQILSLSIARSSVCAASVFA